MPEDLERRVRAHLAKLDHDGLRRTLRPPRGIDLSSNDYLGLSAHPLLKERMAAAARELGCGSTGSRLLRGERECFDALERRFARFKNTERALYFSSGYLANLAVLTTFPEAGDAILSDERNHASIIDGTRLSPARHVVFPHSQVPSPQAEEQSFIVTESLFGMDGDQAPLAQLAAAKGALIVDEAHAVGVCGGRGSGLIEETGAGGVFLSINTAGKALGAAGAFVAGPAWAIEYLIQRARPFLFSTAPVPSVAAAIDASLDLIQAEPERRRRVRYLARRLRESLRRTGLDVAGGDSHIVPIVVGDNHRAVAVAADLQRAGYDVRAIRPPTVPPGSARLRVSVNANLTEEILDGFAAAVEQSLCVATS